MPFRRASKSFSGLSKALSRSPGTPPGRTRMTRLLRSQPASGNSGSRTRSDGENGVIAGHGRLAAAKLLGLKMVPCIELGHLSEAQKRAYIIADNKLALNGLWNEELLRLELTDLKELGANLELTGFDAMEPADIMLGKDVNFKEFDETAADDVQLLTCPKCGHSFPK